MAKKLLNLQRLEAVAVCGLTKQRSKAMKYYFEYYQGKSSMKQRYSFYADSDEAAINEFKRVVESWGMTNSIIVTDAYKCK